MMQKIMKNMLLLGAGLVLSVGMTGKCGTIEAKEETTEAVAEYPLISSQGIRALTIVQDGVEEFRISYEPAEYKMSFDCWEILNPYDENATVDTEAMYALFDMIAGISFASPEELAADVDTGIAESDTYFTVDYVDEKQAQTAIEPDCSMTVIIGNSNGDGKLYMARKGSEDQVYLMSETFLNNFFNLDPFKYLLKIPALVNIDYLKQVDIMVGDESWTMEKNENKYKLDGKKAEKEEFTALYQALFNVFLDSEVEADADREKEEVLRVVLKRSIETAPEIELIYSTWEDEAFYTVAVNGAERFLVEAADVDALVEQIRETF